jgi:hypothetical protein
MKHPLSICGAILFGGSWIFLLTGVGADNIRSVVNMHKLAIAHAGVLSGLGMVVAGYLAEGMQMLRARSSVGPLPTLNASDETENAPPRRSAEELGAAIAEARSKLDLR